MRSEVTVSIRELKQRYKMGLALGQLLPTHDRAVSLPLSTGNALYDAALTDKLVPTTTMNEPEHLSRAFHLVRGSTPAQRALLAEHSRRILNDQKLLLALHSLSLGEDELVRRHLRTLPFRWRFAFPTAAIKPSATLFTGWRKSLSFRLVEDPPFDALRALFRDTLAKAPGVAILKYRRTIQESAALLKYRFEGERERAIHDLCFNNGRGMVDEESLEPIGTFLKARAALRSGGLGGFVASLDASRWEIPITSFMGLLGSDKTRLTDDTVTQKEALRAYAVRCATPVESLLRLAEWGPWMTEAHAAELAKTVREGVIDRGIDIPFFKVLKAFMNAPINVRKMVLEPLLVPLLRHHGERTAKLLPAPSPLTYMQPGNIIHIMSFLLHAVLGTAMKTKLLMLYSDGVEEVDTLSADAVIPHLADEPHELQRWLLGELGGLTTQYQYTYDFAAVGKAIQRLDPDAPLLLDLPLYQGMDVLEALMPMSRVFNLNNPYGAPGEISIAYEYYARFTMTTSRFSYGVWERTSDRAAGRFAELLAQLESFQLFAEAT
jgi:hypothetical protein